jgi:hypothetical protein
LKHPKPSFTRRDDADALVKTHGIAAFPMRRPSRSLLGQDLEVFAELFKENGICIISMAYFSKKIAINDFL